MSRKSGRNTNSVRIHNKDLIVSLYRGSDRVSIADIIGQTRLSRTTVKKINADLLEEGTIIEAGKGKSTDSGGKKPVLYQFNNRRKFVLGFHIKYDQIHFRISDLKYQVIVKDEIEMPADTPFPQIAERMKILVGKHLGGKIPKKSILACMVAIHGNVDSETGICIHSTYFPSWGVYLNIKRILGEVLSLKCPIHIDNWIRYKAYGENKLGLAKGHESVVLIDAGTLGVAAGILLKGRIYNGKHFLSGEIGHATVDPGETERCACGSRGCLEQQVSCDKLIKDAESLLEAHPDSILNETRAGLSLESIFGAADQGDELARLLLSRIAGFFALAISQIIMFFDPEIILIEGGFASGCKFFEGEIERRSKELTLPRLVRNSVLVFSNIESIPTLKGAAALAIDMHYANG